MKPIISALLVFVSTMLRSRVSSQFEIVALRHQIRVYQRSTSRLRIKRGDRIFWSWLARHSACWTGQQDIETFPFDSASQYLIQDRDGNYGGRLRKRVQSIGIEEILTAPRSPWRNAYVERMIGSIRRDCLDHVVVLNERHLKRFLASYISYYHRRRTHLSLEMDSPSSRSVKLTEAGTVVQFPKLGGLHHHYERIAA